MTHLAPQSKVESTTDADGVNHTKATAGFLSAFTQTMVDVFKDKGVMLMLVIAPLIYGFFYPWPYSSEVVSQVPVGIVDNDRSSLSAQLLTYTDTSPQLDITVFADTEQAKLALWRDDIAGYMLIPPGLEQQVKSGKAAQVVVLGNGGYFLLNKNVQLGFTKAVRTVSAGVEVKKAVMQGAYLPLAKQSTQALPLTIVPLFNKNEGYGSYAVPAVTVLIIQQTLLLSAALMIGTWYEYGRAHATVMGWLGRIGALASISFVVGCFYYGWIFELNHYARGHNMASTLLFLAMFCLAVAALGCLLGLIFRQRERAMQILIFSSLPIFFISGYPWPAELLPTPLQYARWMFPTSSGIHASVQMNQMGAEASVVAGYFYIIAGLAAGYFVALVGLDKWLQRRGNASNVTYRIGR